ncbi:MAG: thioredoxin family protein [Chloroflexi bacterium]|nr:thioredoxin family protein [Chloroflexota bacterium]MDA1271867.1 thioredoxin family protein [Chloroflexota bacterium]
MAREDSVVTPERFSQGFDYPSYMAQIKVNKARFEGFYDGFQVSAEDTAFFKELAQRPNGPAKLMVIGEDWCGDVIRGLPVLAKIADAAGIPISIFPRDSNNDIMDEYLKEGQYMSIPVAVFYTADHRYICHWIERPEIAAVEQREIEKAIREENPGIDDREFGQQRRARTAAKAEEWIAATVVELKALLEKSIS